MRIAGSVIVRQRPGTAKGFVFLSMEDETGIMNAIVTPDTFDPVGYWRGLPGGGGGGVARLSLKRPATHLRQAAVRRAENFSATSTLIN